MKLVNCLNQFDVKDASISFLYILDACAVTHYGFCDFRVRPRISHINLKGGSQVMEFRGRIYSLNSVFPLPFKTLWVGFVAVNGKDIQDFPQN